MPRGTNIKKILIIGSGPIVIGQAAEFDYSGTQACKALLQEGYEIVLVNSNPATIMTDPQFAHRTYIEPLTVEVLEEIISVERPDALLPTLGGQTALNLAVRLYEEGILEKYGVRLIGANYSAIKKGEDRDLFRKSMERIGLKVPPSVVVSSLQEAIEKVKEVGFPAILRPAFTLGGTGGSIAYNMEEFKEKVEIALKTSPIHQVLIDKSLIGWKEFEFEVIRDSKDNVIIVCSIENFDPMGVHTGDSITVAPAQTLTDKEYQILRDACIEIMREIGVDTGGSNIQFAVNPETGDFYVIEMNPRVSRSSALASKATGFPIAKVAAKLAVGYTLDELKNDITRFTPASFEPSIDYVVVKIPRFDFAKFPRTDRTLGTMMKSVGEVMAIGRTFKEALGKAIRSLEQDVYGLAFPDYSMLEDEEIKRGLRIPNPNRLWYISGAFRKGYSVQEVYELSKIDPWFLENIKQIVEFEKVIKEKDLDPQTLRLAKEMGYSDLEIAKLKGMEEHEIRSLRYQWNIVPAFKGVDTCAGEFTAYTPYYYSSYERPYYTLEGMEILDED
ncbi:carbamoyl-phosphate synthase large subunit [Hydrogenobacter sp. T-2]|uniref:carbamoyl-phosphate synthase large subunit n=1 Tax=Pampinifervens diazotrophicum TaxID=1632018 RepID=UPI002B263956|nr:carbamoyl-phosphate synthase large subunit [Hydrogenobacter sp. T-2]WPM31181.1 carbamoyl-phosphate synthase large subunit [Hydrogenobacter sp. T-2]